MTAEYLDRGSLVARMKYYINHTTEESGEHYAYTVALREIRNAPAADVASVVHGRWAHLGGDEWLCTACGFVITTEGSWDKPTKKYCEDCGARMDDNESEAR